MRLPLLALISVLLALASGCGGDEEAGENGAGRTTGPVTDVSVGDCLAGEGYGLFPTTSGVSAETPSGTRFTIAFFDSAAEADAAAANAGDATAVGNGVVTVSGDKALAQKDLDAIQDCVG